MDLLQSSTEQLVSFLSSQESLTKMLRMRPHVAGQRKRRSVKTEAASHWEETQV
jgi:hypothetical protein